MLALLQRELSFFSNEAKKKQSSVKDAADTSTKLLTEAARHARTSTETDLANELRARPAFFTTFWRACETKDAKFVNSSLLALQRLIPTSAIPDTSLDSLVRAFVVSSRIAGTDINLKLLQCLPPLFTSPYYAHALTGELLSDALRICFDFATTRGGGLVSDIAGATLRQCLRSRFELCEVEGDEGRKATRALLDAQKIFEDLSALVGGESDDGISTPSFLKLKVLHVDLALELIEGILSGHSSLLATHEEFVRILQARLAPPIIQSFSEKREFTTTIRTARVVSLLLRRFLPHLVTECEIILSLLLHMLEPDSTSAAWRRVLAMEILRETVCGEPDLLRLVYTSYDAADTHKPMLRELVTALNRLASEKIASSTPALMPSLNRAESAYEVAGGVANILSTALTGTSQDNLVVSNSCEPKTPYIEMLDKPGPPPGIASGYLGLLVVECVRGIVDGLVWFCGPLVEGDQALAEAVRAEDVSRSDARSSITSGPGQKSLESAEGMVRELNGEKPVDFDDVMECKLILNDNWPGLLATFSTFLSSTLLDSTLFEGIVGSFGDLTVLLCRLGFATPAEAFMTMFLRYATPLGASASAGGSTQPGYSLSTASFSMALASPTISKVIDGARSLWGAEAVATSPGSITPVGILQDGGGQQPFSSRNLICVKCLLDVGLKLGDDLKKAWSIVLEGVQQADLGLSTSTSLSSKRTSQRPEDLGVDPRSVVELQERMKEMVGKTTSFSHPEFRGFLECLCQLNTTLIGLITSAESDSGYVASSALASSPPPPPAAIRRHSHRRTASSASLSRIITSSSNTPKQTFALDMLLEVAERNIPRFVRLKPEASGWKLILEHLHQTVRARNVSNDVRVRAAKITCRLAKLLSLQEEVCEIAEAQQRFLRSLEPLVLVTRSQSTTSIPDSSTKAAELEIRRLALETLKDVLDESGQALTEGWDIIIEILRSTTTRSAGSMSGTATPTSELLSSNPVSDKLVRLACESVQLICSEYLASVPVVALTTLIETLGSFAGQDEDFNAALTSVGLFWILSDYIQAQFSHLADFGCVFEGCEDVIRSNQERPEDVLALWMRLLLQLCDLAKDRRPEVRHAAIQIIFRVFSNFKGGIRAWQSCWIILDQLMSYNPDSNPDQHEYEQEDLRHGETTNLLLEGISGVFTQHIEVFESIPSFLSFWERSLGFLGRVSEQNEVKTTPPAFMAMSTVFVAAGRIYHGVELWESSWQTWTHAGTCLLGSGQSAEAVSQESLHAFLKTFGALRRLLPGALGEADLQQFLVILHGVLSYQEGGTYPYDMDILSPVQTVAMSCMNFLTEESARFPVDIMDFLVRALGLAIRNGDLKLKGKPTYVAFTNAAIEFATTFYAAHYENASIYCSGTYNSLVSVLQEYVTLKYHGPDQGKPHKKPDLWRSATQLLVELASKGLSVLLREAPERSTEVMRTLLNGMSSMASVSPEDYLLQVDSTDEAFDMAALSELQESVISAIGRESSDDYELVDAYITLFTKASIINPLRPLRSSSALTPEEKKWGKNPNPRRTMGFFCMNELFRISHIASPRIAERAIEVAIRRATMTLENFVVGRPVAGMKPMRKIEKKEFVEIVDGVLALGRGLGEEGEKWPFLKLYPLFVRALPLCRGEKDMMATVGRIFAAAY
ncbi:Endocytosis and vacuole integrity protein [Saitoella coloradoensis]